MNNTDSTVIQDMINKLPITLYFTETPDRQHALSYVQWLYNNVPQSKTVNQDKLFRDVISRELRVLSMKIIEIEILIMVALDKITLDDFTLDSDSLLKKVISQNQDKYDLDMMYRVMAQIMTKLPRDLREQVTGKHKLQVFQKIAKFINMEPKLLEKFMSMDTSVANSLNTPVSMELDAGDYNTLNKKYLDELKKYQESQPYIDSNSLENIKILEKNINSTPTITGKLNAQYIDDKPILMTGKNDNKLYYYDESSGVLTEMPSYFNQKPVSIDDLITILEQYKVKKSDIQKLIDSLNNPTTTNPTTTNPTAETVGLFNRIANFFTGGSPTAEPVGLFSRISNFFTGGSPITTSPNAPLITTMPTNTSTPTNTPTNTSTPTNTPTNTSTPTNTVDTSIQAPSIPQYLLGLQQPTNNPQKYNNSWASNPNYTYAQSLYSGLYQQNDTKHSGSARNNLESKFKLANSTYEHFTNSNSTKITEAELITNMKKNNENIENVAIAFVTIIILLFLLVIFNAIRNKSGLSK